MARGPWGLQQRGRRYVCSPPRFTLTGRLANSSRRKMATDPRRVRPTAGHHQDRPQRGLAYGRDSAPAPRSPPRFTFSLHGGVQIPLFDVPLIASKELPELIDRQASVPSDTAHRVCVDWVVARYCDDSPSIRHDDVLAFPRDLETGFLQGSHRLQVRNSRNLGHYTVTSTSRTSAPRVCSATTARYSSMAERMFASASASLLP